MDNRRIYLASPYSAESAAVRQQRYEAVCAAAARMLAEGKIVFSPIAHSHPIAVAHDLPGDFAFWQRQCLSYLDAWATELWVLTLEGWEESCGVRAEIGYARELGLPVFLMDEDGNLQRYAC